MQAIKNISDKRVIKTRLAIRRAFESLAAEKDVSQITVKDISDRALISRKTFYMHYASVTDVLHEIEGDLAETLSQKLKDVDLVQERFNPQSVFQRMTEAIDADSAFYTHLIHSSAGDSLADTVKSVLKDKLLDTVSDKLKASKAQIDFAVEFVSSGMVSAYRQWFTGDRTESLDEVSRTVGEVASSGMAPLIDHKQ